MVIQYREKTANVQEIYEHLMECKNSFNPPLDQTVNIGDYSKKIFDKSVTFEAWFDQKLIGCVAAYFNDLEKFSGFITNVSVSGDFTGKGIGSQLLHNCIEYAQKNRFKEIVLEVSPKSRGAIQLYRSFNFQENGSKNNLLVMKHILNHSI
ncbi:MAG: GNAT family N-acetyltransferase [Marinifilaceae bacterium]